MTLTLCVCICLTVRYVKRGPGRAYAGCCSTHTVLRLNGGEEGRGGCSLLTHLAIAACFATRISKRYTLDHDAALAATRPSSSPRGAVDGVAADRRKMTRVVDLLVEYVPYSEPFLEPVSTTVAEDYYVVIKNPMDLSTVRRQIDAGEYDGAWWRLSDHLTLIYDNCRTYNSADGNEYAAMATKMEARTLLLLTAVAPAGSIARAKSGGVPNGVVAPSSSGANASNTPRADSAGEWSARDDTTPSPLAHPSLLPSSSTPTPMDTDGAIARTSQGHPAARVALAGPAENEECPSSGPFIAGQERTTEYAKLTSAGRLSRLQADRDSRNAHISMRPLQARTRGGMRAVADRSRHDDAHFPELEDMMNLVPPHGCAAQRIASAFLSSPNTLLMITCCTTVFLLSPRCSCSLRASCAATLCTSA
jgi:hypothetical protein